MYVDSPHSRSLYVKVATIVIVYAPLDRKLMNLLKSFGDADASALDMSQDERACFAICKR